MELEAQVTFLKGKVQISGAKEPVESSFYIYIAVLIIYGHDSCDFTEDISIPHRQEPYRNAKDTRLSQHLRILKLSHTYRLQF